MFHSGGAAERRAVALPSVAGGRIVVHDRGGAVAGSLDVGPTRADLKRWRIGI
jgi:hypothetical protein